MSDEPKPDQKKIIVDEDWKSRVEAEREESLSARETSKPTQAEPSTKQAVPLPPPSLMLLASGLYLQGMIALGLLPTPASDEPEVHLEQAKHAIDTLDMLQQKTEGNRTEQESAEMEHILHELRLAYVAVKQKNEGG